jgi:cell division protein FtsB
VDRRRRTKSSRRRGPNRSLSLFAILFVLALTLAPPIKNYFTQRAQISALESKLASDRSALVAAQQELERWKDPSYVKSQARERLHFVLPGERQYIVTGVVGSDEPAPTTKVEDKLPEGAPWYTKMIASITESGIK